MLTSYLITENGGEMSKEVKKPIAVADLLKILHVENLEDIIADNQGNDEHNPCRRAGGGEGTSG